MKNRDGGTSPRKRRETRPSTNVSNTSLTQSSSSSGFSSINNSLFGRYLTPDGLRNLTEYKYQSFPLTFIDARLTPWWNFCIDYLCPMGISPNAITLLGFLASVFGGALALWYNPHLNGSMPRWSYFAMSASIFIYQTLDAIDGKQARRLKISSPLGQIFDHGCDTFTSMLIPLMALAAVPTGSQIYAIAIYSTIQTQLFLFCWWDMHFHIFPHASSQFSGCTEGQLFVAFVCFLTGVYGTSIYKSTVSDVVASLSPGFQRFVPQFLGASNFLVSKAVFLFALLSLGASVVVALVSGLRKSPTHRATIQLVGCITHLIIQALFYCTTAVPTKYPAICFIMITFMSSTIAIRMELAAVGKMDFSPILWPAYPFAVGTLAIISQAQFPSSFAIIKDAEMFQLTIVSGVFMFVTVYLSDLIISSVSDICESLNVSCFSIPSANTSVVTSLESCHIDEPTTKTKSS